MEKIFKVLPPTMPNFVRFESTGLKQVGAKNDEGYDIANFTKQEAEDFAELMYRTFMEHWESRKSKLEKKYKYEENNLFKPIDVNTICEFKYDGISYGENLIDKL